MSQKPHNPYAQYKRCRCGNPFDGTHIIHQCESIGCDEYEFIECQGCQRSVRQKANVTPSIAEVWNFMVGRKKS